MTAPAVFARHVEKPGARQLPMQVLMDPNALNPKNGRGSYVSNDKKHRDHNVITPSSPRFIEGMIEEWSSFIPASRALNDLSAEHAVAKPDGWPHSIAEVVAHMLYWQHHDFATIESGAEPDADASPTRSMFSTC